MVLLLLLLGLSPLSKELMFGILIGQGKMNQGVDAMFRMKVMVKDGEKFAVFCLFDEEVEFLAIETCPLLAAMGESCSLFPFEMDCMYGDGVLFKVEKMELEKDIGLPQFKVISICNEVVVVNEFIDQYIPSVLDISSV
ncbi:hypothetical protein L195_g041075 [Trifolium pratense]|uniref:Replication factor-A carboxy-terminal domain protein n=1 Tax=Trifolium pratense TaxID=57577 RepID=A0A2K3M2L3_TRIPR|nr:hypothetical protein L195_g041075 [Trifolium pratense]